ncbi:Hypothetical predicted protein [Paramuricea clavata]|uniref:Uncharacterized protein n=1 Tax=Paramuricea clavata TaxID=317549 RepID=A0A7D9IV56_PARCT|nr:Hypothetical predicted protein [Paramuricea clavata]
MDRGLFNIAVFLDLQKAFETINHDILLTKLDLYGLQKPSLNLLGSYLANRTQMCSVNGALLGTKLVTCGIPQGSILGPLLSLIYINDLPNSLEYSSTRMFADDTTLTVSGKSIQDVEVAINHDLTNVKQWLSANRLSLNLVKTEYLLIGSRYNINNLLAAPNVFVGDTPIKKAGHITKNCKANYICRKCKAGKQHIPICESSPANHTESSPELKNDKNNVKSDTQGFVGHASCDRSGILLQTARANVLPVDEISTRIFFDREALCVPTICSPLTNQPIDSACNLPEFKNLELADFGHDQPGLPVGILVGIDYYHTFMTNRVVKSQAGPVACRTRVRWVLSGRFGSPSPDMHCFEIHLLRATVEQRHTDRDLREDLEKFWNVESIRLNKLGVFGDIKQAFLNVGIDSQHRDFLQFLWYKRKEEDEPIAIYRFNRVVFGITSSPFLLNGTIRHHLDKYAHNEQEVAQQMKNDLYVDDLVSGCNTSEAGKVLYDKSKAILSEAGLDLHKWVTNDQELRMYIESKEKLISDFSNKDNDMTYFEVTSPNINVKHKTVSGVNWDFTYNFHSSTCVELFRGYILLDGFGGCSLLDKWKGKKLGALGGCNKEGCGSDKVEFCEGRTQSSGYPN